MARVRLFANLREIAGTSSVDLDGATVDEVLASATDRFGAEFARAMQSAQVWVDGDRVDRHAAVAAGAEVALIPPVSGGALVVRSPIGIEIVLVVLTFVVLFVGNAVSLEWFTVVTVLVASVWALDLTGATDRRSLPLANAAILLAIGGGAVATFRFGAIGMAGATGGAVIAVLIWSVFRPILRPIDSFAVGVTVAVVAAAGTSAVVLLRLRSRDETLVFLFVLTIAVLVSWLSDRSEMPILDPLVALIVGAVLAGAVGGALWAPELLDAIGASIAAAIGLVAGRNLGTLLRAGGFFAQGPIPGSLSYLDGALMAAAAYWAVLTILS
ncbi:MAG: MoaD/ThiS family protein [Actinomycetota bacterium]